MLRLQRLALLVGPIEHLLHRGLDRLRDLLHQGLQDPLPQDRLEP